MAHILDITQAFQALVVKHWYNDRRQVIADTLILVERSVVSEGATERHFMLSREQSLYAGAVIGAMAVTAGSPHEFIEELGTEFDNAMTKMQQQVEQAKAAKPNGQRGVELPSPA